MTTHEHFSLPEEMPGGAADLPARDGWWGVATEGSLPAIAANKRHA